MQPLESIPVELTCTVCTIPDNTVPACSRDVYKAKYPLKYKQLIESGGHFDRETFYHPELSFPHPIKELLWALEPINQLHMMIQMYKEQEKEKEKEKENMTTNAQ